MVLWGSVCLCGSLCLEKPEKEEGYKRADNDIL